MVVLSIFMKLFCNIETVVVGDENQYYNQSCIPRLNFPCFVIRVILTLPVTIPYLLCSVVFFFPCGNTNSDEFVERNVHHVFTLNESFVLVQK